MTQLVQKSRPHFFTKKFLIRFRNVQNVFQKQNNLRRHRNIFLVRKLRPGEQTQSVRFNSIRLQIRIRLALKRHRQFLRPLAQRLWQSAASVISISADATAHNSSQSKFTARFRSQFI